MPSPAYKISINVAAMDADRYRWIALVTKMPQVVIVLKCLILGKSLSDTEHQIPHWTQWLLCCGIYSQGCPKAVQKNLSVNM